jgi:hypothetical protein
VLHMFLSDGGSELECQGDRAVCNRAVCRDTSSPLLTLEAGVKLSVFKTSDECVFGVG